MELKATLNEPYTTQERADFIINYNNLQGCDIKFLEDRIEAWQYTDEEKLEQAKSEKYEEANRKAFEYLESGEAVYEFESGKSIEATDGNIAKLGLALVNFILAQDYTSTIEWNTKENENIQLNAAQLQVIVTGLQAIQAEVWTIKFPAYNTQIEEAQTIEAVNSIVIDYTIPQESGV